VAGDAPLPRFSIHEEPTRPEVPSRRHLPPPAPPRDRFRTAWIALLVIAAAALLSGSWWATRALLS
jgi:hypothetical protein